MMTITVITYDVTLLMYFFYNVLVARYAVSNAKKRRIDFLLLQQVQYFRRIIYSRTIIKAEGNCFFRIASCANHFYKKAGINVVGPIKNKEAVNDQ